MFNLGNKETATKFEANQSLKQLTTVGAQPTSSPMTDGTSESSSWCVGAGPSSDMWPRMLVINTTLVGSTGPQDELEDPAE